MKNRWYFRLFFYRKSYSKFPNFRKSFQIWKSPDVWQLFSSINSSKHFGFSPTIQKLHVVARKPLRTAPFIELQVVHTKIALTWKILGFIAWRPHMKSSKIGCVVLSDFCVFGSAVDFLVPVKHSTGMVAKNGVSGHFLTKQKISKFYSSKIFQKFSILKKYLLDFSGFAKVRLLARKIT